MKKIYAIVGMCGSGKSIASSYLENKGFSKIYFGSVVMDRLKELSLEVNPTNERMVRENLRKEYGMAAFAKILMPKIEEAYKNSSVVLDGVYSWDEVRELSSSLGDSLKIICIVVDKNIRYDRLSKREIRPLSYEEAIKRDITEIENIAKGGPIGYADYYILNNGSISDYYCRLDEILRKDD